VQEQGVATEVWIRLGLSDTPHSHLRLCSKDPGVGACSLPSCYLQQKQVTWIRRRTTALQADQPQKPLQSKSNVQTNLRSCYSSSSRFDAPEAARAPAEQLCSQHGASLRSCKTALPQKAKKTSAVEPLWAAWLLLFTQATYAGTVT